MPYDSNIVLAGIVVLFWAVAYGAARRAGRRPGINLLMAPLVFVTLGAFINQWQPWWGTYVVGGLHVLLSLPLIQAMRGGR